MPASAGGPGREAALGSGVGPARLPAADPLSARSPSGKKFRSKPQLARYLGGSMDLSTFDFRTGKLLMSKASRSRQRVRYDSSSQVKVSARPRARRSEPLLGAPGWLSRWSMGVQVSGS